MNLNITQDEYEHINDLGRHVLGLCRDEEKILAEAMKVAEDRKLAMDMLDVELRKYNMDWEIFKDVIRVFGNNEIGNREQALTIVW